MPSTTWFITGASRGFGRQLTEQLLARGDRVAATLRKPEQLDDLAAVQKSPVLGAYAGNPAIWRGDINLQDMPGDQAKVVKAMLDVVGADDPPRRLLLGSDAYQLVTTALAGRLAAFNDQKDLAFSTDVDDHQPATS